MSLNSIFLEQNCEHALKTCNFAGVTGPNCAEQFCNGFPATSGTCPEINLDPKGCCESSDPASCLQEWVHGGGGSGGSSSGSGDDGNSNGGGSSDSSGSGNPCASVVSIIISCSSASPTLFPSSSIYTAGPEATSLAGCLCYDSDGSYDGSRLDGFASTCVASGSAAHPTYFPYASRLDGFCGNIGGGGESAAVTPAATTTAQDGEGAAATGSSVEDAGATASDTAALFGSSTATSASGSAAATSSSSAGRGQEYRLITMMGMVLISALLSV